MGRVKNEKDGKIVKKSGGIKRARLFVPEVDYFHSDLKTINRLSIKRSKEKDPSSRMLWLTTMYIFIKKTVCDSNYNDILNKECTIDFSNRNITIKNSNSEYSTTFLSWTQYLDYLDFKNEKDLELTMDDLISKFKKEHPHWKINGEYQELKGYIRKIPQITVSGNIWKFNW
jgi:hypothetical protein